MKKHLKQIIILIILIGIIVIAQIVPYGSSMFFDMLKIGKHATLRELKDFKVRDTAAVDRIFMVDKNNNSVDLRRMSNNEWTVNGKFQARPNSIDLLLETLHLMQIKAPVAKAAEENIFKRLATKSVKVEVYDGDEIIKTYYIGGVTQSQTGTYALLEGSNRPFIVEIPGFRGYLSGRFFITERLWRNTVVFHSKQGEIDRIVVNPGDKPDQAFQVKVTGHNQFELFDKNNRKVVGFDSVAVKSFVHEFEVKSFDRFVTGRTDEQIDSLYQSPFFFRIKLHKKNGEMVELSTHRITEFVVDDANQVHVLNGVLNKQDWILIQTYVFSPVFKYISDFKPKFK